MKNIKSLIGIIIALFIGQSSLISHTADDPYNYLIITQKIEQLQHLALTSAALAQVDGERLDELKVVLYGPEVVQLTDITAMNPILPMARNAQLNLGVLAMALDKLGVDHTQIPQAF